MDILVKKFDCMFNKSNIMGRKTGIKFWKMCHYGDKREECYSQARKYQCQNEVSYLERKQYVLEGHYFDP